MPACVFALTLQKPQEKKALEFVSQLKACSFLPEAKIEACVQVLCDKLGAALAEKLHHFIRYFEATWMKRMLRSAGYDEDQFLLSLEAMRLVRV